jgi:RNA polymerase sigma factor (sigma-70 family)
MDRASETGTSPTLLGRLRQAPADQAAWAEFVDRYGPKVYHWCRQWRLQEADAQDVTQDVLAKLAAKMRGFAYDPARSFRSWLKTLTRHALDDFVTARGQVAVGGGRLGELETVAARADLLRRLEETFDLELLEEAMARVRLRVEPRTWEAFRLLAVEDLSGAEVAARLGMRVATVFVAKSKVQRLLQEETARLEGPEPREE